MKSLVPFKLIVPATKIFVAGSISLNGIQNQNRHRTHLQDHQNIMSYIRYLPLYTTYIGSYLPTAEQQICTVNMHFLKVATVFVWAFSTTFTEHHLTAVICL